MNISNFFNAYPGIHILQAFLHSLTAAVIVDRSIHAWGVTSPLIRQRFRLIAILAPVFSYPLYQIINPGRGSIYFRLDALFDSARWLNLELWGKVPVSIFFIAMLAATALIFLVQELIPIMGHAAESKRSEIEWDRPDKDSLALKAVESLPEPRPDIFIADDDDLIIYSTTGNNPAIFLSTGLINNLECEELQASIAHEFEHIRRSRRSILILTYLIRVLQFFSPATLVEFRKVVEDEEKICDDAAVEITGKPGALAEALKKLRHGTAEPDGVSGSSPKEMMYAIELYSHDMLLKRRIYRLSHNVARNEKSYWLRFAATLATVLTVNYFVV
jgi:Zn-dependent protease with chaperone function